MNADLIAAGLSPLQPASAALRAGRLVLERIHELGKARKDFGFESTLAGQSHQPLLQKLAAGGFRIHLYYLWLPSSAFAAKRVKGRPFPTVARISMSVHLPHHFKGTHMSRFLEVLSTHEGEVAMHTLPAILHDLTPC